MSFLTGDTKLQPVPGQNLAGINPARTSTAQQAIPVPVAYGINRMGVKFLTNAFNQKTEGHTENVGKEDRVVGINYFASFGAHVCHGPVDELHAIYFDTVKVWPPTGGSKYTRNLTIDKLVEVKVLTQGQDYTDGTEVTVSGSATLKSVVHGGKIIEVIVTGQGSGYNPLSPPGISASIGTGATFLAVIGSETFKTVTITNGGRTWNWTFYWGMEATDYDPLLLTLSPDIHRNPDGVQNDNASEVHSAYSGQCYFVANQHYLGYNSTNVQEIEIVVGRFPTFDWLADARRNNDSNLAAIIVEDLRNPRYGLAIDVDTRIDKTNFSAISTQLAIDNIGISPLISRVSTYREVLKELLQYVDGFIYTDTAGKIALGLVRPTDCETLLADTTVPYYDERHLSEPAEMTPDGWDKTFNLVYVTFTNADNEFKEDSVTGTNLYNFQVTKEPISEVLQRPWFTRSDLADSHARIAAQVFGVPEQKGRIKVRKSKLQGLKLGGIFKLSYGHYSMCWQWCRAKQIRVGDPYLPEVEIEFTVDRGYLSQRVVDPPLFIPPEQVTHEIVNILNWRVIEAPYVKLAAEPEMPKVIFLAQKPTNLTTQFAVHLIEGSTATQIKTCEKFALHGKIASDLALADTTIDVLLDGVENALPVISGYSSTDDAWLMVIGDEIFGITEATLLDGPTHRYTLGLVRERADSKRAFAAAESEVYIIKSTDLINVTISAKQAGRDWHNSIEAGFKVQPFVLGSGADLAGIDTKTITFSDREKRWWKPKNLACGAAPFFWYAGNGTFSTGQDIHLTWTKVNRDEPSGDFPAASIPSIWYFDLRLPGDDATYPAPGWRLRLRRSASESSLTIPNASIIGALGSEQTFVVRAFAIGPNGLESRHFDEQQVDFV